MKIEFDENATCEKTILGGIGNGLYGTTTRPNKIGLLGVSMQSVTSRIVCETAGTHKETVNRCENISKDKDSETSLASHVVPMNFAVSVTYIFAVGGVSSG